jgi:hypothetical protein
MAGPVGLLGRWEIGGKVRKVGFNFPTRERYPSFGLPIIK